MLTKETVLKQVSLLTDTNTVEVKWAIQVKDDDSVLSETILRKSYKVEQKQDFVNDVPDATKYFQALGWDL